MDGGACASRSEGEEGGASPRSLFLFSPGHLLSRPCVGLHPDVPAGVDRHTQTEMSIHLYT